MSDSVVDEVIMQSDEQGQAPMTAGALLREAREAARVQLPSLAATLKVPQRKLEALEADDYAAFPDQVFMRALAMGMCRTLRVDAEPVMALLPRTQLKSLGDAGSGINESFKERRFKGVGTPVHAGEPGSRKIIAGVLLLLAAAAAVYFVPMHKSDDASADTVAAESGAAPEAALMAGAAQEGASALVVPQAGNTGDVPATPAASAETAAAPVAQSVVAGDAVSGAAPVVAPGAAAPVADPAVAPASTGVLGMRASIASWVRVKDATGKVVFEKTLAKDEAVTVDGALPLAVTIGNAKGVEVSIRGEALDIVKGNRDNVARFAVK